MPTSLTTTKDHLSPLRNTFYISLKIAPPALERRVFVLDPSPSSPTSPRPVSPRSYHSHPIPIKDLPNSSSLSQGPGLSPPPPVRFRVLSAPQSLHKRARSAPSSLGTFVPASSDRKVSNHVRTQSTPQPLDHYAAELRDSDHRDRAVRSTGDCRIRDLRDPEPSQHVREEREGGGRRRRMTRTTLHVRFQLDDDTKTPAQAEETSGERKISGLLRLEDERDSWF